MVLAPPVLTGKDKLDPRLMSLCMSNDVDPVILDLMGENGLVTCALLKHVVEDDAELRAMLNSDPFNLNAADFATKRKIGAVCAVYEQCQVSIDIQVKADAERLHHNLPPEITEENYEQAITTFEQQFYPLEGQDAVEGLLREDRAPDHHPVQSDQLQVGHQPDSGRSEQVEDEPHP